MITQPDSNVKRLEIESVACGFRETARQLYLPKEVLYVSEYCKKKRLYAVCSEFSVKLKDSDKLYSNKGVLVKGKDKEAYNIVYISKTEKSCYLAQLYDIKSEHLKLADMLGYPECCAHFFQDASHVRSQLDNDYVLPVLNNSPGKEYPFLTNIFQRHNDQALIFHFPCSLGCKKSIELGKRHLSIASGIMDIKKLKGEVRVHDRTLLFS